jgi:hypothetical protein
MKFKQDIRALCEKLKPVIGDNADRLWNMYLAEDDKGKRELEQEIEIIAEKLLKKKPLENEQILLTPPSKENSSGNFLIGNVIYNRKAISYDRWVFLPSPEKAKPTWLISLPCNS